MQQDEKQEALYTVQALKARTAHLLNRAEKLSAEAHQLRLMQAGLAKLRRFVESVKAVYPGERPRE